MNLNSRFIMQTVGSVVAVVLILWGTFTLFTQPSTPVKQADLKVASEDHIRGEKTAPVTIIEYSDFQCPACGAYAPMILDIVSKNPKTVRLVYRHFPLDQHIHAREAAHSAEAAGKQGKFFEYHDMLFENQKDWEGEKNVTKLFRTYAQDLKLDLKKFDTDITSTSIKDLVENSHASALNFGVDSTPTFFINGIKVQNPRNIADFQKEIDTALKATQSKPATK